ncbi:hypothetical protein QM806_04595 [Rhodococcus sp. IEGM 1351]|uniref:hypothetical protein n=1 Tax=Rhodococcus sp. IEGM 1351 TaxID=3047089 RepID=UPI0024B6EFD1|nr:hypothetical protein [Rhodococcus sp. IEGM 1351]MDI9934734.1 hypothetical protein [Rhodococcus sp. IEGM 1351]
MTKRIENQLQFPAYSVGYLLQKLPHSVEVRNHFMNEDFGVIQIGGWANEMRSRLNVTADTPEDAACKLAIELFKQGDLKRDGDE